MPSCDGEWIDLPLPWSVWGRYEGDELFAVANLSGIDQDCRAGNNASELVQVLCR